MATTPMTFKVEIPRGEWYNHPLRMEWENIAPSHPLYGGGESMSLFLKQEHNINIEHYEYHANIVIIELKTEQDYILWKFHQ